jgi:hypothetical protein
MPRATKRKQKRLPGLMLLVLLVLVAAGLLLVWLRSTGGVPAASASATTGSAATGSGATGSPAAGHGSAGATATDPPYNGSADGPATPPSSSRASGTAASSGTASRTVPAKLSVQVATTYFGFDASSGGVLAGGFVDGVIESGGTCTLTLSRNGAVATGTSQAEPDATTTSCGEVRVDRGSLSSGDWTGVLSYSSRGAAGASQPFSVKVP